MKFLLIFLTPFMTSPLWSMESSTENISLHQALQKEYVYLNSQKQALLRLKLSNEKTMEKKKKELSQEINQLENQLVQLTAQNDEQHEILMTLDQRKKELEKRGTSLQQTYAKAQTWVASMKAQLQFEIFNEKEFYPLEPSSLAISTFSPLVEQARELIRSSAETVTYPSAFLNEKNQLVEGTVTRFGRSAAIGQTQDQYYILAPNGEGLLKTLEQTSQPIGSSLALFVFDNLLKEAQLKRRAGLTEKMADLSPIVFLALILLLVAGLFAALIKV